MIYSNEKTSLKTLLSHLLRKKTKENWKPQTEDGPAVRSRRTCHPRNFYSFNSRSFNNQVGRTLKRKKKIELLNAVQRIRIDWNDWILEIWPPFWRGESNSSDNPSPPEQNSILVLHLFKFLIHILDSLGFLLRNDEFLKSTFDQNYRLRLITFQSHYCRVQEFRYQRLLHRTWMPHSGPLYFAKIFYIFQAPPFLLVALKLF